MEGKNVVDMTTRRKLQAKPPKPARAVRAHMLAVKMNDEEKRRIADLAAAEEKTMSQYIREVVKRLTEGWELKAPS